MDRLESETRVKKTALKEKLSMIYLLGSNIRERFSDGKIAPLWDLFPELFEEEKARYEEENTESVENIVASRKAYAKWWNERNGGEKE